MMKAKDNQKTKLVNNQVQLLVEARDFFFKDEKNFELLKGEASGQYLKNRLEKAFIAGWDSAIHKEKFKGK